MSVAKPQGVKLAVDGGSPVRTEPFPAGAQHGAQEIGDEEKQAVLDVLERGHLFRFTKPFENSYVFKLEEAFKEWTGQTYALATNAGTNAIVAGLAGLGVGTGDEVIVPAYTYISTAAAVVSVGAIPIIAEIDDTLTLDPKDLERLITPRTRCIIPVHMRGLPCQMDEIMAVADRHGIPVLEDVAQADGGTYRGRALGSIGKVGIFSFQFSKIITSGEGGMLVTNDLAVATRASYRHDAAMRFWVETDPDVPRIAGQNFRMSELSGAVAFAQFGKLQEILARTRRVKDALVKGLAGLPGISVQRVSDPVGDCGIRFGFYLPSGEEARRFSQALRAEGIPNGTIYNQGIEDRHIYVNWDYILEKVPMDASGWPWAMHEGDVAYSRDMCPRSLEYLGRNILIQVGQAYSERDVEDIVAAIAKVAYAYYG